MSERYLVTGVQLGMLKAYADNKEYKEVSKLVDRIVDEQFVGQSRKSIQYDVEFCWRENVAKNPDINLKKNNGKR